MDKPALVMAPRWNWGMLLPANGYSRCYRCRRPWWAAPAGHSVEYAPNRGQFALCESCWAKSSPDWRWHAHNFVCAPASWPAEETWTILDAVALTAWG